ncbi:MAG TPA: multicopper oxidase domain-containing protein [Candidatus Limnocylindrales bacterium]
MPSASPSGAAPIRLDPNAPIYDPRDPRPPARLPGATHDIELVIDERFLTVAEGIVQKVWSISSQVPGPVIRVEAGDMVRVHLVNHPPKLHGAAGIGHPAVNDYPHALQFDGMTGAGGDQTATLKPAEDTVFEFRAETPGVWMYHGSTQPTIQSIAYGMYGMLIVEPKGGLGAVDQELFFVQGEWYLAGTNQFRPPLPSLAKAEAAVPAPDFVLLNGIADQYQEHPIHVGTGTRIRAFLLDAGPNLSASFRIEGVTFDRVDRYGNEAAAGSRNGAGLPAVDLSPGKGAIVEFSLPHSGQYQIIAQGDNAVVAGARAVLDAGPGGP